jgi:hypothetical protein
MPVWTLPNPYLPLRTYVGYLPTYLPTWSPVCCRYPVPMTVVRMMIGLLLRDGWTDS